MPCASHFPLAQFILSMCRSDPFVFLAFIGRKLNYQSEETSCSGAVPQLVIDIPKFGDDHRALAKKVRSAADESVAPFDNFSFNPVRNSVHSRTSV